MQLFRTMQSYNMSALAKKKLVLKEVKNYGLAGALGGDAVDCIATFLDGTGGPNKQERTIEDLQALLQLCQRDRPSSGDVTRSVVEACISLLNGQGEGVDLVAIINAFDVPKISYDPVGRKMFADSAPRTLFADAQAKHRLYLDRLQLITQRIRRHKYFQQNYQVLAGASDGPSAQLTDLQSLKGVEGQQRFVMGCVSRGEDGVKLVLEDGTGSVPLDISQAQWPAGFFTENCVVIAQGVLSYDGVFHAQQLGLPPVESREELAEASKRLNFFGGPTLSTDELSVLSSAEASGVHREDRIVVVANVWLDKKETLDRINKLLTGFHEVAIIPPIVVFMGNFHSKAPAVAGRMSASQRAGGGGGGGVVDYQSLRQGFASLASLIDKFPRFKDRSRFVFVPGPGDPSPSDVLPQPPLPEFFRGDILRVSPNAVFASNPCRIRYLSQQVVLFRYDILKRLRRRCLLPISGGEPSTPEAMWQHLALTLLQQSHLCPLPLLHQPIYWQADHALSLYPLPHAVVVADMSPPAAHTHVGCTVFTPGSFAEGHFACYVPGQQAVELSDLQLEGELHQDDDEDDDMVLDTDTQGLGDAPADMGEAALAAQGQGAAPVDERMEGAAAAAQGAHEEAEPAKEGSEADEHGVAEEEPFAASDLLSPNVADQGVDELLEEDHDSDAGLAFDRDDDLAVSPEQVDVPSRARKHARVDSGDHRAGMNDGGGSDQEYLEEGEGFREGEEEEEQVLEGMEEEVQGEGVSGAQDVIGAQEEAGDERQGEDHGVAVAEEAGDSDSEADSVDERDVSDGDLDDDGY